MKTYIVILRGINVGGKRIIQMNDLKSLFKDLGFTEISTYIQSGNILFKSSNTDNSILENKIEKAIKDKFGFDVPVIIRTSKELENLISSNPFYDDEADINKLHLTFLKGKPKKEIESSNYDPDKFAIFDKDVFIYCEGKYHQTKLSNNFFEKKLMVGATTRNWKTILKLRELSR